MGVVFVNPQKAEELMKSNKICDDPNMYVVLQRQRFLHIEDKPYPENAKIVHFDIFSGRYSYAYVCEDNELKLKKNYADDVKNYSIYYNNVLVAKLYYDKRIDLVIHDAFKIEEEGKTYLISPNPGLSTLFTTSSLPRYTSFVSISDIIRVIALKVQDICIIHQQIDVEMYNFLFALCGEKPLLYLDYPKATAKAREKFTKVSIFEFNLVEPFEFKRDES